MILNIIILYDKVGCLLDILGQEKCFQCLQREKSAQSLSSTKLTREGGKRRTYNISSLPCLAGPAV